MQFKPFCERQAASGSQVHENELLNRVFQNRGISDPDEINYSLFSLIPPNQLEGIDKAVSLLISHITQANKILVIGDYDCDGATSTAIAVEGLRLVGARNVDFLVPDRATHGYGLSPAIVAEADGLSPDLIVTVDNGISAFEGAQEVKKMSKPCQLIITDHHLAVNSGELPSADAIVNPNQPACQFPSKNLAGCGVMFYVILALRAKMRELGLFASLGMPEPKLTSLLDLVALGTVADVVPLDYNNRLLVSAGLKAINSGACRPGLKSLLELKGKQIGKIVSSDFGFSVGPCINAAGRLEDMTIGIRCLLARDESTANTLAVTLHELNEKRKRIEAGMVDTATEETMDAGGADDCIILHNSNWHEGVVGIVASRLKDKFNRPVICFTDTKEIREARADLQIAEESGAPRQQIENLRQKANDGLIKGSARSVAGIHLKHLLDELSKNHPDVLSPSRFGGHAMAAGLSIKHSKLKEFRSLLAKLVCREMTDEMRTGKVMVDIMDLEPNQLTVANALAIRDVAVWGQGFDEPVFGGKFDILSKQVLQSKHLKLKVRPQGSQHELEAIAFRCVDNGVEPVGDFMEASYRLGINEWRGDVKLQLVIDHMQDPALQSEHHKEIRPPSSRRIDGAATDQKAGVSFV